MLSASAIVFLVSANARLDFHIKNITKNCSNADITASKFKLPILEDTKIKEIDAVFYDLLDAVESDVATKLEDAYLESGARAVELAYLQGIKDGKEEKTE